MSAVLVRIALRYLTGALVSYGFLSPEIGAELAMDPDVALALGAGIAAATESLYALAKRMGGKT